MGERSKQLKGARFGAYEIVRLLGHGATASVFEANHVGLDKPVAVKLLHEHLAAKDQTTGRFLREGRVAAKLQHPNIVNVLDVGAEHGVPFLVMELLHGQDLRSLLADVGVLSVEHALGFLLPILSALAHAHAAGVIHRDLKPANIFLSRDARDVVVPKLVDFGLSKVLDAAEPTSSLTSTGLVAGTVLYMAPEQAEGVSHSSPASDQYSIAAILYEAVTGNPPFKGDGVYDLLSKIRTEPITPPSQANPQVSAALDPILLRALARSPADRWPSVAAFGRALVPFADGPTGALFERELAIRAKGFPSGRTPSGESPRVRPDQETRAERAVPAEPAGEAPKPAQIASLPCPAGTSPFHIKGLSFRSFMLHVGRSVGLEPFVEKLGDPSLRTFVAQPFLASHRYDVFPYVPLFATLADMLGVPFDTLVRTSTEAQVRFDARTAYRMILDASRPEDIVERLGRFNTQIYDFGVYRALLPAKNHVDLRFEKIPAYIEPWFAPMHVAYTFESLRLAGARDVVVLSQETEDAGTQRGFPLRNYRTQVRWGA